MSDTSKLNKVTKIIIECFKDAGYDDAYIHSKIERVEGMSTFDSLYWAGHQLDSDNKARFAEKIGVTVEDLMITFETIRKLG